MINNNKSVTAPVNHQIRAKDILILHEDGNKENISLTNALKLAQEKNLDLIQISTAKDGFPVCKIADYGKFRYDMQKKQKDAAKRQRESLVKTKEIKFHPNTEENDLLTKASKTVEFINDGDMVKICIIFRGREINHKEIGMETLAIFLDMVPNGQFMSEPSLQGRMLSVMIGKKKK